MQVLGWVDWLIIGGYVAFAVAVGVLNSKRASRSAEDFFLSGRSLPWWLAGTSMVATSFAADTPLVVSGWVRDHGVWRNWVWWCFAASGMLGTFLFARWWRRGEVMTKAELAEVRYGGRSATALRLVTGLLHAGVTNLMVLCWVMLAAAKILEVLLDWDKRYALLAGVVLALGYSSLSGLWGVVWTDLMQFAMAVVGAMALAAISWNAVGGADALGAAIARGDIPASTIAFFPSPGPGGFFDASFWTVPLASLAVLLGVAWWAVENIDGSAAAVQRISATRDERHGLLAVLWFNVLHYALRPWPWIVVALASLVAFPTLTVEAPVAGEVVSVADSKGSLVILPDGGGEPVTIDTTEVEGGTAYWFPRVTAKAGARVEAGALIARTDSERAYMAMMIRYLPAGLLGLVAASLLAAFMSTIDTHINLASSFFVNDVYRRFLVRNAPPRHYVWVARAAGVVVMSVAAFIALGQESISELFLFFLAFLSGVGPVYVLRWLWWRITAGAEIVAMVSSGCATIAITLVSTLMKDRGIAWRLGPFADHGVLTTEGRLLMVVGFSLLCVLAWLVFTPRPNPAQLVTFYKRVRPFGAWGPVRKLAGDDDAARESPLPALSGIVGGLMLIYGALFATGSWILGEPQQAAVLAAVAIAGATACLWGVRRMGTRHSPVPRSNGLE